MKDEQFEQTVIQPDPMSLSYKFPALGKDGKMLIPEMVCAVSSVTMNPKVVKWASCVEMEHFNGNPVSLRPSWIPHK